MSKTLIYTCRDKRLGSKMSGRAQFGNRNPMFGKHHSEETKAKIKARLIGKHPSEETKAKMKGKHQSQESIEKRRVKLLGIKRSEETKAKHRAYRHTKEAKIKMSDSKIGEKNPLWKGEKAKKAAGRLRAIRKFECPEGFERHHKDGNPLNNAPENIQFVTRKQHMELDGRLQKRDYKGRWSN